jgi:hypothetical protein
VIWLKISSGTKHRLCLLFVEVAGNLFFKKTEVAKLVLALAIKIGFFRIFAGTDVTLGSEDQEKLTGTSDRLSKEKPRNW